MTSALHAVCFDAIDPDRLALFWGSLLGWESIEDARDVAALVPDDDTGFRLRFRPTDEPKRRKNQAHFDLTSPSLDGQQETVEKALQLGAEHVDVGQRPDEPHVVLADPEGNEFCVIEPGNGFLAGCGFLGAVACDGSQAVGYFWSRALGWPLVWDQGEETAIRSPHGGPKVSWGGPPFPPKVGRNRLHFDVAAAGDVRAEVERLLAIGATRLQRGADDPGWTALADPDGNEFCVLPAG